MLVPGVERVEAQHVERFITEPGLHDFGDVAVVPEAHVHVLEAAIRLVDSVFRLVLGHIAVGVVGEVLMKDDVAGPGAADGEGVADNAPLRFTVKAKAFTEVVEEADENDPSGMTVTADGFGCLEQVLD